MADLNVCRICLVHANNEKLMDIFGNSSKLGTEIFLISGIQIMEFTSYDIPALICEGCLKDLKVAIKFRNRARSSDKTYFRNASYDIEEQSWKNMIDLKCDDINDSYEKEHPIKFEEIVEEYLETSDQEIALEDVNVFDDEEIIVEEGIEKSSNKIFQCEYCMQILSTKKGLDYHLKVKHNHNVTELFACGLCGKQFPLQKILVRHMAQAHSIVTTSTMYECSECKETFTSSRMLTIHMNKDHDPDAPGEFPCEICGKIFSIRKKMKKHMTDSHKRKRRTKVEVPTAETHGPCSTCGKFFKSRGQLTLHERTHVPIKPSDYYYCDLCGNKFKAKSPLLTHVKLRHIAKIRFHCPDCPNRNWSTKYALQNHIKVYHHNIREFCCEWCGKGFGAKDKLTAHIRIHTGEKPFQCQYCGKEYTHQTDYIRHVWSHTGERRYTCQMCKQGYIKKSQLESHRCPWKS